MSWPTTTNPRTEFVTLRLTVDEAAELDWLQSQTGTRSRSAALRGALIRVVEAEHRRARKQKRAGSLTVPEGGAPDDDTD